MPSALAVDWSAVETTYAATGGDANATAAIHGISDPAAVRQRASRGKWKASHEAAAAAVKLPVVMGQKAMSQAVTSAPKAVAAGKEAQLAKLGGKSRLHAAKAVAKGMQTAAGLPGEAIIAAAPGLASLGKLAVTARLPEWAELNGQGLSGLSISIHAQQGQVVDVEATVTRDGQ